MTSNISFVYFDVGGVLVKDFSCTDKWEEMKTEMGITQENSAKFEELWNQHAEARVCLDYAVDSLLPILKAQLNLDLPENFSLLEAFVQRFERNEGIWQIVDTVGLRYQIGLLTNMFPGMLHRLNEQKLLNQVEWDAVIDSSQVMFQKPDEEIFATAQKAAGVAASQILFIDNTQGHLAAAKHLGWQTYHFDSCNYQESNELLKELFR